MSKIILAVLLTAIVLFVYTDIPYNIILRVNWHTAARQRLMPKFGNFYATALVHPFRQKVMIYNPYDCQITEELLLHEQVHVDQIQRDGSFIFCFRYLMYNILYGYYNNPYEVEARRVSSQ